MNEQEKTDLLIHTFLREKDKPLSVREISEQLKISLEKVRRSVLRLLRDKSIKRVSAVGRIYTYEATAKEPRRVVVVNKIVEVEKPPSTVEKIQAIFKQLAEESSPHPVEDETYTLADVTINLFSHAYEARTGNGIPQEEYDHERARLEKYKRKLKTISRAIDRLLDEEEIWDAAKSPAFLTDGFKTKDLAILIHEARKRN